jgi:hypothetical protein
MRMDNRNLILYLLFISINISRRRKYNSSVDERDYKIDSIQIITTVTMRRDISIYACY